MNESIKGAEAAAREALGLAPSVLNRNQARAASATQRGAHEEAEQLHAAAPQPDDVSLFRAAIVLCRAAQQVPELASALHDVLSFAAGKASCISVSLTGDDSETWGTQARALSNGADSLVALASSIGARGFQRHRILGCWTKTEQLTTAVTFDVVANPGRTDRTMTLDPGTYVHKITSDATYDYFLTEDDLPQGVGRAYSIVKLRR